MHIRHAMQKSRARHHAARHYASAVRHASVAGVLAVAGTLYGAVSGAAAADPGDPKQVVVQPDPVAPGGEFSLSDGGNCTGGTGEASFEGGGIPKLPLSMRNNEFGGTGTVPETTRPGTYTVTVTCGADGPEQHGEAPAVEGDTAYGDQLGAEQGAEPGAEPGAEQGAAQGEDKERDREQGDGGGRRKFTGTLTVSGSLSGSGAGESGGPDASEQGIPGGGSNTGLGGGSGSGLNTGITAVGSALLAGAVGWGVVLHRRRTRGGRG
ncbi:hypothetical protein FCH28_36095 [Streptomyces piniterrae]|uniref:Uncharacterized protein n=1 Tax=Streptomyces piniterrae TaxID=2571125 RepID=A0A4U0MMF9_9ACTN|nr:hypothetical protein [Streptomyces piniterrae]TJZ41935.1 hypothetical protein FCH28_36095 [Streptomyces piniterrae]